MSGTERKWQLIAVVIIIILVASIGAAFLLSSAPEDAVDERPIITVTVPSENAVLSGIVTFNITIADEENLTADVYIDGSLKAKSNAFVWDTTLEPDGRHTIRVSTEDSAGHADTRHFQVTIDNVDEQFSFDGYLKIMEYNIKESGLNDGWKDIIKQENPDIVVLVETGLLDNTSNESLNAATSELNAYFSDEMPYDSYTAQNVIYSTTGEAILSRFPVLSFTQVDTVPLDDGTSYYVTHDFIDALVDINGTQVHVIGGHLKASGGETNQGRREAESEGIINYMDNLGNVPILYLSDQNSFSPDDNGTLAPDTTMLLGYGPMTMMLYPNDTNYGQYASKIHNFTDVFRELNPSDPGYTFGGQSGEAFMRIDYIIANSFFDGLFINSSVIDGSLADSASDHYAITAWLNWTSYKEPVYTATTVKTSTRPSPVPERSQHPISLLAESKKLGIRHVSRNRNYGKTSWGVTFHLEEVGTQRGMDTT